MRKLSPQAFGEHVYVALELHRLLYLTSQVTGSLSRAFAASRCHDSVISEQEHCVSAECCSPFAGAKCHRRRHSQSRSVSSMIPVSSDHGASIGSGRTVLTRVIGGRADGRSAWLLGCLGVSKGHVCPGELCLARPAAVPRRPLPAKCPGLGPHLHSSTCDLLLQPQHYCLSARHSTVCRRDDDRDKMFNREGGSYPKQIPRRTPAPE